MSQDHLERYVRDNRQLLDDATPDPAVWDRINDALGKEDRRIYPWRTYMWRAAAVALIFALSWVIHDAVDNVRSPESSSEVGALSAQAEELFEAEAYYTRQIEDMQSEVFALTVEHPDVQADIRMEMSELDTAYAELRRDLGDQAANEEIIEAMIQNYRLKINILSDILQQLRGTSSTEGKEAPYEI